MKKLILTGILATFLNADYLLAPADGLFRTMQGFFIGVDIDASFKNSIKAYPSEATSNELGIQGSSEFGKKLTKGAGVKYGFDFDNFKVYHSYFYNLKAKQTENEVGFDGNDRVEIESNYAWKNHKFIAGIDFTPSLNRNLKLVGGGYFGFSFMKIDLDFYVTYKDLNNGKVKQKYVGENRIKQKGVIYGGKIGAEYSLDAHSKVEIGVKIKKEHYRKYRTIDLAEFSGEYKFMQSNYGPYLSYIYRF